MAQQAPNCLIELGERVPAVRYLIRDQTLPQIEKLLAEAAEADARYGALAEPTPRTLATRAERRDRLTRAPDRLAAVDQARRDAQRASRKRGTLRLRPVSEYCSASTRSTAPCCTRCWTPVVSD